MLVQRRRFDCKHGAFVVGNTSRIVSGGQLEVVTDAQFFLVCLDAKLAVSYCVAAFRHCYGEVVGHPCDLA